ncbi:hypothetical protein PHMEG_00031640 [Phytophthora megakarya]|uniref:DDE Tnp4 domain-containing protein n=1 Tax=Phytophthora megakarya TaxID=4795 RepID=A0A225UXQ6_9STRA|nr:hypothetical protein PHMEG_00031640 [Phytophthora megakarya]
MMYFTQGGTLDSAASVLRISRSRAVVYINECINVLNSMVTKHIDLPCGAERRAVAEGFYKVVGFPGVIGAVDGTLIAISRSQDYESWYCRKRFPVVNVQAVVDYRLSRYGQALITTSRYGMDLVLESASVS